jgi:Spy/CpxP family protein refolding chaperone
MPTPMKTLRRAALTVAAFALAFAFTAQATAHNQDGDNDTKVSIDKRLEQMKKRLALTDEQVGKIEAYSGKQSHRSRSVARKTQRRQKSTL